MNNNTLFAESKLIICYFKKNWGFTLKRTKTKCCGNNIRDGWVWQGLWFQDTCMSLKW